MSGANGFVERVLSSRFHRLLSKSTAVIRYTGRRSGTVFTTPVQYARHGSGIVIAAADPDHKTWWRNFGDDHHLDVLIAGTWISMTGLAIDPDEHPDEAVPLIDAYTARYPSAAKTLRPEGQVRRILVWCRPC